MIDAREFKDQVIDLVDELYITQKDNIERCAEIVTECIENGGVGSGHSVGLGIDITGRVGSLVPIHIMETSDFVTKGIVPLSEFQDKTNIFERRPNVAQKLYALYDIKPQDVFIVISNSSSSQV